jgi:hypothetical protein
MNIRSQIFGQNASAESPLVCAKNPKGARPEEVLTIAIVRELDCRGDTRLEGRYPLSETAQVTRAGKMHKVDLINVCSGGAMITAPFEAMLFERLQLRLGEQGAIRCSVIWIKHGRIGLEFTHETQLDCPEDEQGALLREVIQRHYPKASFDRCANDAGDELREEIRHPFIWSGTLHCAYGSTPARLRNISPEGAMIETSFELAPGAEPYLDLGEAGSLFGAIVWAHGDQSGLKFHQRFDLAKLAHARPELSDDARRLIRFGSPKH